MPRRSVRSVLLTAGLSVLCGCPFIWETQDHTKLELGVDPQISALAKSFAYRDTVGAYTYYAAMNALPVRGYGLVVGLGKNGSKTCPRPIYERLVQDLTKRHDFSGPVVGVTSITPERIIQDEDTAVVLVEGEVPAASLKGGRFDVSVRVVPGTETRSLRGGRLFSTDLRLFHAAGPGAVISGKVIARAAGPLFSNPFSDDESATRSNPLEALVVRGGAATEDRHVTLVLGDASYSRAKQIQDRINAQFPGDRKAADAISPSFIYINVPEEYRDEPSHFLALVRSLFLSRDPTFEATRARQLSEEILHADAPHANIALCFESLGRTALPELNRLYAHERDYVSFYVAAAGLRLGDHVAADAMALHAGNPASPYRLRAITALGRAPSFASARMTLRTLLEDEDARIRVAAYEELARMGDVAVDSVELAEDNFHLDRVSSKRPPFIYVKRSGERRIALFGGPIEAAPPLFYRAPEGSFLMDGRVGQDHLTLLRVTPNGEMSPQVRAEPDIYRLIELMGSEAGMNGDEVTGLGLDYGAIVRALYHLCADGAIEAEFVLEQPLTESVLTSARAVGRRESE
jgi:hypothetical protein